MPNQSIVCCIISISFIIPDFWVSSEDGVIYVIHKDTFMTMKRVFNIFVSPRHCSQLVCHSGLLVKCMTTITIPSGDTQVWCCASSENERFHILLLQFLQYLSTLAIIAANSFEIIENLKVNQSVSCMAQLSSSVVCLAGFGVVIEMDVNTRKVWDSQISCNIYAGYNSN